QQGMETYTELYNYKKVTPPSHIIKKLNLSPNEEVYLIERIYYVDDRPLAFSVAYFPSEYEFTEMQVKDMKLYELIEKQLSIPIDEATYKIDVSSASDKIDEFLNNEPKLYYFKMVSTSFCKSMSKRINIKSKK